MARITPPTNTKTYGIPSWMKPDLVIAAGKGVLDKVRSITKVASVEKIASVYSCTNCSKTFNASNKHFQDQKSAGVEELTCPNCNNTTLQATSFVAPINKIDTLQTLSEEKRSDLQSTAGTTNSFVDRHFVFKAVDALSQFASRQGMWGAVAKYIKSEHKSLAGADIPTLNDIECKIEWMYGKRQKAYVTASISIDHGGQFIFPKVFKTAAGVELPFEEVYIRKMEKETSMREPSMIRRKSDQPTFRKVDPSNFKAASVQSDNVTKVKDFPKE